MACCSLFVLSVASVVVHAIRQLSSFGSEVSHLLKCPQQLFVCFRISNYLYTNTYVPFRPQSKDPSFESSVKFRLQFFNAFVAKGRRHHR